MGEMVWRMFARGRCRRPRRRPPPTPTSRSPPTPATSATRTPPGAPSGRPPRWSTPGPSPAAVAELDARPPQALARSALLGEALSTLRLEADGRLATVEVDQAAFRRAGAAPDDTEDIINHPRAIDGVRGRRLPQAVGARHSSGSACARRDRRRPRGSPSCFGGGGHTNAAGCTIDGDLAVSPGARSYRPSPPLWSRRREPAATLPLARSAPGLQEQRADLPRRRRHGPQGPRRASHRSHRHPRPDGRGPAAAVRRPGDPAPAVPAAAGTRPTAGGFGSVTPPRPTTARASPWSRAATVPMLDRRDARRASSRDFSGTIDQVAASLLGQEGRRQEALRAGASGPARGRRAEAVTGPLPGSRGRRHRPPRRRRARRRPASTSARWPTTSAASSAAVATCDHLQRISIGPYSTAAAPCRRPCSRPSPSPSEITAQPGWIPMDSDRAPVPGHRAQPRRRRAVRPRPGGRSSCARAAASRSRLTARSRSARPPIACSASASSSPCSPGAVPSALRPAMVLQPTGAGSKTPESGPPSVASEETS